MSYNICLDGRSSTLVSKFYPPIELNVNKSYEMALVECEVANTIPNVTKGRNRFYYRKHGTKDYLWIEMAEGSYEVDSIATFIEEHVPGIVIKPNSNTMKVEIISDEYDIDFAKNDCIGPLLGFSRKTFKAKDKIFSDRPVDIMSVTAIRVSCNLVSNSYVNGSKSHVLFSFAIDVDPGYKMSQTPSQLIYLPINKRIIDEIILTFHETNNKLVNFRGESVSARLHIRECLT